MANWHSQLNLLVKIVGTGAVDIVNLYILGRAWDGFFFGIHWLLAQARL